jgi:hypothetical protein
MKTILGTALAVGVAALAPTSASAQLIKSGRTVTINERNIGFEEPVKACLKLCTKVIVERQAFECAPFFAPGYDGCDLPWIDAYNPNPDYGGQGFQCIPSEPEFAGYHLSERVERVERTTRQDANCQTVISETVLQVLPDRGNPPRPCPDPGPWASSNETLLSLQFISCR